MDIKQIESLIKKGESSTVEFKTSTAQLRAAFETICAFLNGAGGFVIIGINNSCEIVGQEVTDKTRREIGIEITKLVPNPNNFIEIDYILVKENKSIIVITVHRGNSVPYEYEGRAFQRNQSTTVRMPYDRREELHMTKDQSNASWEKIFVDEISDVKMLDHDEIKRTIRQGIEASRIPETAINDNIEQALHRLNLYKDNKFINATLVLFSKEPLPEYSQCLIQLARFRGLNKNSDFIDNQQVYGNAFKILTAANNFIMQHLPVTGIFREYQLTREDKPFLPVLAIREALINAICHRDYRKGSIMLSIFDDRMEIWNYGGLPPQLKVSDLKRVHHSLRRNELISDVFYKRGFIEKWGIGTNKMVQLCREHNIPEPKFEEDSGGLLVKFKFKEAISRQFSKDFIEQLNPRQEEILKILKANKSLNANDIFSKLKFSSSLRTVKADLSLLKKRGLIEQQGKGRNTFWKIKI